MVRQIVHLDPSLGSPNLGDLIVADSVRPIIDELAGSVAPLTLPTQRYWGPLSLGQAISRRALIVGGTNLLTSHMKTYRQWKIRGYEATLLHGRGLLMGVGWWQYQRPPDRFTARILTSVLGNTPQAARDSYTKRQLESIGIPAINTGCPTMWYLPSQPEKRTSVGRSVVFTLTDYLPDTTRDRRLVQSLSQIYPSVSFWPQGRRDAALAAEMGFRGRVLGRSVEAFNAAVSEPGTDYVGTRLHAGIRALQLGARATVVQIDNRAKEIGLDTGLPTIDPGEMRSATDLLTRERVLQLRLPRAQVAQWMAATKKWLET